MTTEATYVPQEVRIYLVGKSVNQQDLKQTENKMMQLIKTFFFLH